MLEEIYPYLIIEIKRKRAKLIIQNYKALTPRNGRYSPELLIAKENLDKSFIFHSYRDTQYAYYDFQNLLKIIDMSKE